MTRVGSGVCQAAAMACSLCISSCPASSLSVSLPCAPHPCCPAMWCARRYFSKEKASEEGYNLACILTFPAYQRKVGRAPPAPRRGGAGPAV